MSAVVTKQHRLSVAQAWEGEGQQVRSSIQAWVDGQNNDARLERLAQLVADAEGPPWRNLYASGLLAVREGETYQFAIHVSTNGSKSHWEYFTDAIVWDSETDPDWSNGEHGWDINDETWFRPLPKPPEST